MEPVLVVHGGAGNRPYFIEEKKDGISNALEAGYVILKSGGSALDAVVKAVVVMEDDPHFNAGYGSVCGIDGQIEMDASVMTSDGRFGAVAAIKNVKNPVLIARKVMEETEHHLIVGENATRFARVMGFGSFNPLTPEQEKRYREYKSPSYYSKVDEFRKLYGLGTVGAIAIDKNGDMAVAASTGGLFMHLPGRVGDTPIIGAGIYSNALGAVTFTGFGERIMKNLLGKVVVEMLKDFEPYEAVRRLIQQYDFPFGVILIDKKGRTAIAHSSRYMAWGTMSRKGKQVEIE